MHVVVIVAVLVLGFLHKTVYDLDVVRQRRRRRQLRDTEPVRNVVELTVVVEEVADVGLRGTLQSASAKRRAHVGFARHTHLDEQGTATEDHANNVECPRINDRDRDQRSDVVNEWKGSLHSKAPELNHPRDVAGRRQAQPDDEHREREGHRVPRRTVGKHGGQNGLSLGGLAGVGLGLGVRRWWLEGNGNGRRGSSLPSTRHRSVTLPFWDVVSRRPSPPAVFGHLARPLRAARGVFKALRDGDDALQAAGAFCRVSVDINYRGRA